MSKVLLKNQDCLICIQPDPLGEGNDFPTTLHLITSKHLKSLYVAAFFRLLTSMHVQNSNRFQFLQNHNLSSDYFNSF